MIVYSTPPPRHYIERIQAERSRFRHSVMHFSHWVGAIVSLGAESIALNDRNPKLALFALGTVALQIYGIQAEKQVLHALDQEIAEYDSVAIASLE